MTLRDLQAKRDQLEVGDDVLVKRSPNPEAPTYRGTIQEINARMAVVRLALSQKCEVIPLTKLSKVVVASEVIPPQPVQPRPLARPKSESPIDDLPDRAVNFVAAAVAVTAVKNLPSLIPVGEVTPAIDDVSAWLDMGVQLINAMTAQIHERRQQARDIIKEGETAMRWCKDQAAEHNAEADALCAKLDLLTKLTAHK